MARHQYQPHSPQRRSRRRLVLLGCLAALLLAGLVAAGALMYFQTHGESSGVKAEESAIKITTEPKGATISLDGQPDGTSNKTVKTTAGKHTLKLQLKCYDDQEVQLDTQGGKTATIDHIFTIGGKSVVGEVGDDCKARSTYQAGELKIYKSDKFNFTIAYPKEWLVQTDDAGVPHFYNKSGANKAKQDPNGELEESLAVLVLDNPQQLGPEAWYKAREEYPQEDQSQIKQQVVTINGQPAYRYETPYGFVPYLNTVFTRGDKAYLVQQFAGSTDRTVYDQIVQTFKLP